MNKEYIEINKNAYEILANEYNTRNYKIGYDFWNNIYDDLNLKNKENIKILEIGPGHGRNIKFFKQYNNKFKITALEISKNMCNIIKKDNPDVQIINDNILNYSFENDQFDIIQMIAVIHLFPIEDAKIVLRNVKKSLKEDGYLIIGTTINEKDMEGYYEKEDYNIKVKRFRHKYTKETYEKLLNECGFEIYKPYFVNENDRNKLWYDAVCKKVNKKY